MSATDSICTLQLWISLLCAQIFPRLQKREVRVEEKLKFSSDLQVLNQDETPLLYSLVFGEGVVNDAASIVLFNAIQKFDVSNIDSRIALQFIGNFLYLFATSTLLGVFASLNLQPK
ncbi:unnamed protein product [Fraxinus pennsylvanica]|uniref:Cation/H+ exchanger transmembrane domain-containing protein n=1 Tax=Fraxinus pennsylvanica TaxID=56036 RepID=A0AAD2ADH0_9LAMI|nr:unnamed protein product [Fraxinus pennsylvanica]